MNTTKTDICQSATVTFYYWYKIVNEVKKFSILMVSKKYGSLIASCNPPKMIKDSDGGNNIEKMFDYRQQLRNKFKK